jgi:hypothetical protein
VKELLEKAKECSLLAVDIYNKPKTSFRSGAYIVLMTIAFTSLFHAVFEKNKIKYFHRKKDSNRFVKIDGDYKTWELSDCIKQYFKENNKDEISINKNIEFFIPLRNKIEHRFMPDLDKEIFGECQALLHNFEYILIKEFGEYNAINESLVFSLQFAKEYPISKKSTVKSTKINDFKKIKDYIQKFRNELPEDVFSDQRYSFKVYLIPKLSNSQNKADYAIEWVNYDPSKPEEMKNYERLTGIIKEKVIPISNLGLHKAGDVAEKVRTELVKIYGPNIKFSHSNNHFKCCMEYNIRPKEGDKKENTKKEYCVYDSPHADYLYTDVWINLLIKELSKKDVFLKLFPNQEKLIKTDKND